MKFSLKKIALFGALTLSLAFTACEEDSTTSPTVNYPNAPTALKANSKNITSVALAWTASTTTGVKYIVETYNNATLVGKPDTVNAITFVKTGLESKVYNFKVWALDTNGKSETSANITWAPAHRFNNILMYETASSSGSGLQLSDPAKGTPDNLTIANKQWWDICLDTRDEDYWLGSPNLSTYNIPDANATKLYIYKDNAGNIINFTSLDQVFDTELPEPTEAKFIDCNTPTVANGFVLVAKAYNDETKTYSNFAKILIKVNGGTILKGQAPNRFVEMDISYQALKEAPYAK